MNVTFDDKTHTYTIDGIEVPSVTQVISAVLGKQFSGEDAEYNMSRGRAVHEAARIFAEGDDVEVAPEICGFVEALRKFWKELSPQPLAIERVVANPQLMYAGTLDLCAIVGGKRVVVDYKTGGMDEQRAMLQLGGYGLAYPAAKHGCAVNLRGDGEYRMTKIEPLEKYKREFAAMRTVYAVRERMGLNKQEKK